MVFETTYKCIFFVCLNILRSCFLQAYICAHITVASGRQTTRSHTSLVCHVKSNHKATKAKSKQLKEHKQTARGYNLSHESYMCSIMIVS